MVGHGISGPLAGASETGTEGCVKAEELTVGGTRTEGSTSRAHRLFVKLGLLRPSLEADAGCAMPKIRRRRMCPR